MIEKYKIIKEKERINVKTKIEKEEIKKFWVG